MALFPSKLADCVSSGAEVAEYSKRPLANKQDCLSVAKLAECDRAALNRSGYPITPELNYGGHSRTIARGLNFTCARGTGEVIERCLKDFK